jgi:hypothetical protein
MTNEHLNRRLSHSFKVDVSTLATNKHTCPRRTRVVQALNSSLGSVSVFLVVCEIIFCLLLENLVELVVGFLESSAHLLLQSFEGAHPELCLMPGYASEEEGAGRTKFCQSFKINRGAKVN